MFTLTANIFVHQRSKHSITIFIRSNLQCVEYIFMRSNIPQLYNNDVVSQRLLRQTAWILSYKSKAYNYGRPKLYLGLP